MARGGVSAAELSALRSVLGEAAVIEHEPVFVDGAPLLVTLRPEDGDSLARSLAVLGERSLAAIVRGGGTQLGLGNPPTAADALLSVDALAGIHEFDPLDGVVHAGAATEIAVLAAHVRAEGWELPLESTHAGGTLGGAISTASVGPRQLGLGRPRDCLLGISVSLASGERTRSGGRVVKNVTGYDLGKLYAGSLGTLAVIESAWIRLRPPPAVRVARSLLSRGGPPSEGEMALALEVSRRVSTRIAAWVSPEIASRHALAPGGGTWVLLAEFAGDDATVARDVAWLEEAGAGASLSVFPTDETAVDRLGEAQGSGTVRARLAVLPSKLWPACAPLVDAGVGLVVHAGVGLAYAISTTEHWQRPLAAIDSAATQSGAELRIEELPVAGKEGRDVFGNPGARLPLLRSLKQQFDPAGTLNPGRFQGRI
jgi:glycolate oxidase FAD binding subunit